MPDSTSAQLLYRLNVSANHKGFRYLEYGMEFFSANPDASVTKMVYPAIGDYFNTSAEAVERDIRRAISSAWENCDLHTWKMYFQCDRDGSIPRPTNTAFLATLAQRMSLQNRKRA